MKNFKARVLFIAIALLMIVSVLFTGCKPETETTQNPEPEATKAQAEETAEAVGGRNRSGSFC